MFHREFAISRFQFVGARRFCDAEDFVKILLSHGRRVFEREFPHHWSSRRKSRRDDRSVLALPARRLRRTALLLIVDLLEIGVDDFVIAARSPMGCAALGSTAVASSRLLSLLGLVERFSDFHRGLRQGVGLGLYLADILAAEAHAEEDKRVGVVLCLDQLATALVFLGVRLG